MRLIAHLPLMVILAALGALAMLIPAAYAQVLGELKLARIFTMSAGISAVLIAVTALAGAARPAGDSTRAVLLTLFGTVTLLPAMLAVPLWAALPDTGILNAWWEMVSSLTTTGASLYDPDRLPLPLHLWRGLVGWLGGLFMLCAAIAIMAPLRIGGFEIMSSPYGRRENYDTLPESGDTHNTVPHLSSPAFQTELIDPVNRMLRAGRAVLPLYLGVTLALWMVLLMLGDPSLLALMRAMGTVSTSGISPVSTATGHVSGIAGEIVIFVFMIPALSRRFWPGGGELVASETWRDDPELRMAGAVVLAVTAALFLRHFISAVEVSEGPGAAPMLEGLADALSAAWGGMFNALSFLTTTGWNSIEWQGARRWSGFTSPGLLLAGLAIMGGGVATAAGGVKLLRVYALGAHAQREMEKLTHPSSIAGGGRMARRLRAEGAFLAFVFFMLFAISIAVVIALVSLQRIEFESATILSISALTNTGQLAGVIPLTPTFEGSAGLAGAPWDGWAGLPVFTKIVMAGAMIVGRVETLALLALFNPELWRR